MPRIRSRSTIPVCTRLTAQQIAHLDFLRGEMTRSRWIERLVQARLIEELHDRSYPETRGGDERRPGYIGAFVSEIPRAYWPAPSTRVFADKSDVQLARLPGADDGSDAEVYEPTLTTEAPMDVKARRAPRANPSTASAQTHDHDYAKIVAKNAGRTLRRCACGALSGWLSDS